MDLIGRTLITFGLVYMGLGLMTTSWGCYELNPKMNVVAKLYTNMES